MTVARSVQVASNEVTMRPSGATHRLVLAVALAGLATAVGSARGGFDAGRELLFGSPPVARTAPGPVADEVPEFIDLHDGRSPVSPRWQASFERFAESDRLQGAPHGGIAFVGSSSIDLWGDLPAQFPNFEVVQRGLGGATMADCARYVDRLILPSRPRIVVLYAGDNDLAAGVSPERIVEDYAAIVRAVHRDLPTTRFVFVSIKPSPSRAALTPAMRRTNSLIEAFSRADPRLDFVDVFPMMLDHDGQARPELFRPDRLHMNAGGYALWRDAILPHLD